MLSVIHGNQYVNKKKAIINDARYDHKARRYPGAEKTLRQLKNITPSTNTRKVKTEWHSDDRQWQNVFASGRRLRQLVEEEHNNRTEHLPHPQTSWKASALLAGITTLSNITAALFSGLADSSTNSPPEVAPVHRRLPRAIVDNSTTLAPASTATTVEKALLSLLKLESNTPAKELLIASVAGRLLPAGQTIISEHKALQLARHLLQAAGMYGGKRNEKISLQSAKSVIRRWIFRTVFHTSLQEYIAKKIIEHKNKPQLTLQDITKAASLSSLNDEGILEIKNIPSEKLAQFKTVWKILIREEIPVLDDEKFKDIQSQALAEYNFLAICTGAEYFSDQNKLNETALSDIITTGAGIWGEMSGQNAKVEMLPYLITPALWSMAQISPNKVHHALNQTEKSYAPFVVSHMLNSWKDAQEHAQKIENYFSVYQAAFKAWDRKGNLAEKFVALCPSKDIFYIRDRADDNSTPQSIEKKKRDNAKELYLLWDKPPCNKEDVPRSLNNKYQQLTKDLTNAWGNIDRILIENVISSNNDANDFIFSPSSSIRPVSLNMRSHRTTASGLGGMVFSNDVFIELDNTDLFIVRKHNQERIYGLKKNEDSDEGYKLHLLNKDIELYIKLGLLSYKPLWNDYTIKDGMVIAGNYEFRPKFTPNPQIMLSGKTASGEYILIDHLSKLHNKKMYDTLYNSGNDKAKVVELWNVIKGIIPFYDCIEGMASGNSLQIAQALPSCFIDALAFVPVAGQAAALSSKYGLSLANGIRSGVLKTGHGASLKSAARLAAAGIIPPTRTEIQSLLVNILRVMDPGLEQLYRKSITTGVSSTGAKSYQKAKLPNNGPEVSVKKVGQELWVMVNPQTDDVFGNYYHLQNGELQEVEIRYMRSEASFDSEPQLKRPKLESVSTPAQNHALPPAPGKTATWESIRKQIDALPLPTTSNTAIQRIDNLIRPSAIKVCTIQAANESIMLRINQHLGDTPWKAYSGIKPKASQGLPPYISYMQRKLYEHIKMSRKTFSSVRKRLSNLPQGEELLETFPGKYLSAMLNTKSADIIHEVCVWLKEIADSGYVFLKTSKKNIKYKNIVTLSTELKHTPESLVEYTSTLSAHMVKSMPIAIVLPTDPEARIFFFADRILHSEFTDISGGAIAGLNTETLSILTEFINHEITHLTVNSYDMFVHRFPLAGKRHSGKDVKERFDENLLLTAPGETQPKIFRYEGFNNFIKRLKQLQGITNNLDEIETINAIRSDIRLYTSVLLSDAQTLAIVFRDLAVKRAFDATIRA